MPERTQSTVKKQPTKYDKIFGNHICDKELMSSI